MSKVTVKLITVYCGFIIIFCFGANTIFSCSSHEKEIRSDINHVKIKSNNKVILRAFAIPNGIFRGVLWPAEDNENFQIWTIEGGEEHFYNIQVLEKFKNNTEVTGQWNVKEIKGHDKSRYYLINRRDKKKLLELELPLKKRDYSFAVLQNDSNDELIIFMDISERIEDNGLFGYILIN